MNPIRYFLPGNSRNAIHEPSRIEMQVAIRTAVRVTWRVSRVISMTDGSRVKIRLNAVIHPFTISFMKKRRENLLSR
jgi:hypothetical protein